MQDSRRISKGLPLAAAAAQRVTIVVTFEHTGKDHPFVQWVRKALIAGLLTAAAVLLVPFTLLVLLLRGVAELAAAPFGRGRELSRGSTR